MKQLLNEKLLTFIDSDKEYTILDFGCGSGELLETLSKVVSKNSKLIGIDTIADVVKQAKIKLPKIDFRQEQFINSFNFPNASFDIVISVDTFECIINKESLVNEIHRILKPNGKVIFAHWDWDTQVYNSMHKNIIRAFVAKFSDWQQPWMDSSDGLMGRKLWGQFQGKDKFQGHMDSFSLLETEYKTGMYGYDRLHDLASLVKKGDINSKEYDLILHEMKSLSISEQYFYSLTSFIYCGTKI
ncbi:MAG: methyltransferase domain-containing protein [Methylococcales bacterium]|nr:methyltransferase domain-containing protein [Methylococcales bacterium]